MYMLASLHESSVNVNRIKAYQDYYVNRSQRCSCMSNRVSLNTIRHENHSLALKLSALQSWL